MLIYSSTMLHLHYRIWLNLGYILNLKQTMLIYLTFTIYSAFSKLTNITQNLKYTVPTYFNKQCKLLKRQRMSVEMNKKVWNVYKWQNNSSLQQHVKCVIITLLLAANKKYVLWKCIVSQNTHHIFLRFYK